MRNRIYICTSFAGTGTAGYCNILCVFQQQPFVSCLPPSMDDLEPTIGTGPASVVDLPDDSFLLGISCIFCIVLFFMGRLGVSLTRPPNLSVS